jgi:predicted Zn-dependent protease
MAPCYQLELRDAATIGPNAFALPGGIIVVTDQLVDETESINEVLAILAHEIGHTELRHPLRSVLHGSLTAIIAATITADAGSLSAAVTSLPFILLQTKYSREMESAADEFAFRLLRQHDLSPELFAKALERLSKGSSAEEHAFSFLSTHPVTAERIERARAAARVKPAEAYRRGFDLGAFPRPPEAGPGIPVDR